MMLAQTVAAMVVVGSGGYTLVLKPKGFLTGGIRSERERQESRITPSSLV